MMYHSGMRKLLASVVLISSITITTIGMTSTVYASTTSTHTTSRKTTVHKTVDNKTYDWCSNQDLELPCSDTSPKKGIRILYADGSKSVVLHACDLLTRKSKATQCFTYQWTNGSLYHTVRDR